MENKTSQDQSHFVTSLKPGVLYEAPLPVVWELETGSSYGNHYEMTDMGQYVLVMATDEEHPEGTPWMLDTQAIDRENDPRLMRAISQDDVIEATAERCQVTSEFLDKCVYRHHYRKCLPITDAKCEQVFTMVADLREWHYATEDEARAAKAQDSESVIDGISLFRHHGWQWQSGKRGIAIMRD